MLTIFFFTALLGWLFYKLWTSPYNYWKKRGIPSIPGTFPFGSKTNLSLLTSYQGHTFQEIYDELAPHAYGGIFIVRSPVLFLRDPEIIKHVMVKDFSNFVGRMPTKTQPLDSLSRHLFNIEGDEWRALRVKLTPTFTSGKLKAMFPLFVTCAKALDSLLLSKLDSSIDIKDVTSRFSLDVIGNCAFGLDIKSLANPDSEFNVFRVDLVKKRMTTVLKMGLINAFPGLLEKFLPRAVPKKIEDLLLSVVKNAVEYREKNGLKQNDFLSLLIDLKNKGYLDVDKHDSDEDKTSNIEMTTEVMTAQCFVFFAAGFETSSSVQSYCFYELALHPEIQDRLRTEIDKTVESHGGVTYQAIQEMQYLDMVVSETLRKYPTLSMLTRRCIKTTELPGGHSLEEGMRIIIPVYALHHSPQYFPKPEQFDPERFSSENRTSIVPYTYLPFGEGPRNCIGMRFGLLQTKMGIITVLRKFNVEVTKNTMIPVKFIGSPILTIPDGPIMLKLTHRK